MKKLMDKFDEIEDVLMSEIKWKIFIATHKKIYDKMYQGDYKFNNEQYVFLNVGQSDKLDNSEKYHVINQKELPNFVSLGKWWAESEGIYNIWRSGIYKSLDFVGFLHYDKELCLTEKRLFHRRNITQRIGKYLLENPNRAHISFETHDIQRDYNQHILADVNQPDTLQGEGNNCYDYILKDYNDYFKTSYTLEDLLNRKEINLCSCFMMDTNTFEKMMKFWDSIVMSKKLEQFDTKHQYRIQGGLAERYFGVFLAFEYEEMEDISLIHHYNKGIK